MHRGWNRWAVVFVLGMTALVFADGSARAGVKKKADFGEKKETLSSPCLKSFPTENVSA